MRNFIATLFLLLFSFCTLSTFATTYYLSSSGGNDNNSGTDPSSPWQSINKLNSVKLSPGDNVLFLRGDTFYGGITASNSGNTGNPITYGAYGSGAKPVITGFTSVTSWTNKGGNIWESTNAVSALSSLKMVLVNGVNTPMGRYPNSSSSYPFLPNFLYFQSHSGTGMGNSSLTSSDLSGGTNWTGADMVVRVNSFTYDREKVASQSGNTLNYVGQATSDVPLSDGWGFFIQNDIRTLDTQNEWYYNPSTGKISIYSIGMPTNVQVSTVEQLFYLYSNSPSVNSTNIDNLNFTGANTNGMWISGNLIFSVTNCNISYTGVEGLLLYGGGIQSGIINNNSFSNCASSSIFTTGDISTLTITNNTMVGSGMISVYKSNDYTGGGMVISAPNTLVQYNTIDSSAYCGLSFTGNNIQIRNNFINHSNMVRDDAAGIYTGYQNQTGKIIDGNIVLNSVGSINGAAPGNQPVGYGIFIDGFGTNISITNNTIANCTSAGINLHDAKDITVNNNTAFNNGTPGFWGNGNFFVQADADQYAGYVRNNNVTNNIFFAKSAGQSSVNYYAASNGNNNITTFGTVDYNYYAKPIDPATPIISSQNIGNGNMSLSQWQSLSGQDANSKEAPKAITDTNDLKFVYNPSNQSKTFSLNANYIDVKGNNYNGSITLSPYSSAVLIKNGAATQNQSPIADAGNDQTITLPSNTVSFSGSGTDPDGSIVSYSWSIISGPSGSVIANSSSASTTVTGLVQGKYQFALTVTDNGGASGSDTVQVIVNAAPQNGTPIANAGSDQSISLPTNTATLSGSGSVAGGTISSYSWTEVSGPSSGNISNANSASSSVSGLVEGTYVFQLKVTDNNNVSNTAVVTITVGSSDALLPAVNPGNTVNGLNYSYFEASNYDAVPDFTQGTPVKTGNVSNFDITVANRAEQFAINYTGYINVPTDGQYTFYTSSDDGSTLYIDGVKVVDNDGAHGQQENSGTIGLQAGLHAISVGFFNQTGYKVLQVSYEGPGISKQQIPSSALYIVSSDNLLPAVNPGNTVNGLNYSYFEASNYDAVPDFTQGTPVKTGNVSNFDITVANRAEQFAINYTGYINVPTDGQYTFYTSSDDGSTLYIDGVKVVDNDGAHGQQENSGTIGLQAGLHAISVGFFNQTGYKVLQVSYEGPGISKQQIPSSALYIVSSDNLLPAVNPGNTVNGLNYSYFEASNYDAVPDFTQGTPVKTGNVSNFDITVANRAEQFAINYTGYINVPTDGQYTFYTSSDDGSTLYIDGVKVVDNDGAHGQQENSGTIGLQAGLHAISVGFFNQTGYKVLQVSYEGPGISKQQIPSSALYIVSSDNLLPAVNPGNTVNGLNYSYFEASNYDAVPDFTQGTPVKTGNVSNFDISVANRAEQFAINYTGYINVPTDGQYTFYTSSDDGSTLYIDGVKVVDNDGAHGQQENSGTIGLQAGLHAISVGFFNQTGYKVLQVSYEGPGISKQQIPSSALYISSTQYRVANTGTDNTNTNIGVTGTHNLEALASGLDKTQPTVAVTAYPNPFTSSILVNISGSAGPYDLILLDALGRTLLKTSGNKDAGLFQQTINAASLQRGIYFLQVIQQNKSTVIKLEK